VYKKYGAIQLFLGHLIAVLDFRLHCYFRGILEINQHPSDVILMTFTLPLLSSPEQ
jgi:hypothetical protein